MRYVSNVDDPCNAHSVNTNDIYKLSLIKHSILCNSDNYVTDALAMERSLLTYRFLGTHFLERITLLLSPSPPISDGLSCHQGGSRGFFGAIIKRSCSNGPQKAHDSSLSLDSRPLL